MVFIIMVTCRELLVFASSVLGLEVVLQPTFEESQAREAWRKFQTEADSVGAE